LSKRIDRNLGQAARATFKLSSENKYKEESGFSAKILHLHFN